MFNTTIKARLIVGFGLVIFLAVGLGLLAITKMGGVADKANNLSGVQVPLAEQSFTVQRTASEVSYNILNYSFSEDETRLADGRKYMVELLNALKEVRTLAEKNQLEKILAAEKTASENVAIYTDLVEETAAAIKRAAESRKNMTTAATSFMDNCYAYLKNQDTSFDEEVSSNTTAAALQERKEKLIGINNVIDLGYTCQLANYRAQALADPRIIEEILDNFDKIVTELETLRSTTRNEANLKELAEIEKNGLNYKAEMKSMLNLMNEMTELRAKRGAAAAAVKEKAAEALGSAIDSTKTVANEASTSLGGASKVVGIGLFVVAGLAITIALLIVASIVRPVKTIVERIKDIAQGEGDLTKRVPINGKDELAELGTWFNTFVEKLHGIIYEVSGAVREVATAAAQIAASSEEMSAGMKEQANQTAQVGAAVEEMSATVVEVARKSSDAAGSADMAGKQALDGGDVVRQTIDGINAIATVVSETAHAIEELGKSGEQIGEIIGVINDIADQTNLLALNAAIEAARAGEHGRGFAVVADEVRKLAERTTQATQQVTHSIKTIQTGTHDAVARMNQGTVQVQEGVKLAEGAGSALETIVAGAQQVSGLIQTIAAASEQQSAAAEQISRSIEGISAVTRQSTEGVTQAAAAAHQLSAKSTQLQDLIGQFKL